MKKLDNDIMKSTEPMQVLTTQKQDYIPFTVNRRAIHQPPKYNQPEGDIDSTTSYAKEYNYKFQEKVKPIRHERTRGELGQFDSSTTNKSDFRQWAMNKTESYGPQRRYERPDNAFEGASTYNNDFHIHHSSQPRDLIKPITNTQLSTDPFVDITSNRRDYTRHPIPEKIVRPQRDYAPNKIPLDGMTTMKLDFQAKQPIRMQSFKPNDRGVQSEEPFLATTTQKDDFQTWNVRPEFAKKDNGYKQPLGEMDLNTNYSKDFTGSLGMPAKAIRPEPRKKLDAKFEGKSTYLMDFQKTGAEPRRGLIKGVSEYQLLDAPFEGQSTYKTEFYGTKGSPAKTTKPDLIHVQPADPFVADTSYRTEYIMKSKY